MKIRIKVYKGRKNNRTYIVILGALRLNRADSITCQPSRLERDSSAFLHKGTETSGT